MLFLYLNSEGVDGEEEDGEERKASFILNLDFIIKLYNESWNVKINLDYYWNLPK